MRPQSTESSTRGKFINVVRETVQKGLPPLFESGEDEGTQARWETSVELHSGAGGFSLSHWKTGALVVNYDRAG